MKILIQLCFLLIGTIGISQTTQPYFNVSMGNGNGLRLWNSDSYKIHMGDSSEYKYGPVNDFSIKTNMTNTLGRGWVWGVTGQTPIAALNNVGDFQVAKNISALGKLGIGTDNPTSRVTIVGSESNSPSLMIRNSSYGSADSNGTVSLQFGFANHGGPKLEAFKHTANTSGLRFYTEYGYDSQKLAMTIEPSGTGGRLGVGTDNPSSRVTINGQEGGSPSLLIKNSSYGSSDSNGTTSLQFGFSNHNGPKIEAYKNSNNTTGLKFFTEYGFEQTELAMTIKPSSDGGNVGIGTASPDAKLAVKGKVHAQEVLIDMVNWSDFVFETEYYLPTLEEVEMHIQKKGHLKDIPSAEKVIEDGINLGEMNAKLLRKIEELTLYTIHQQKEIDSLYDEFQRFKKICNR